MEFHLPLIFSILSLTSVASHAALPAAELYWNKVLPNTPMPSFISVLLKSGESMNKDRNGKPIFPDSTFIGNYGPPHSRAGALKADQLDSTFIGNYGPPHSQAGALQADQIDSTFIGNYGPPHSRGGAPNADQLDIFFFEENMRSGKKMKLHLLKNSNEATFLPGQTAKSIPFSSNKFPEILKHLAVEPESEEAKIMKDTIESCEDPAVEGETRTCATSLESMIDFTTLELGNNVKALTTEVTKGTQKQQIYTITGQVKKMSNDKTVSCHKASYPYAVFYCHSSRTRDGYLVSLVGADGEKVNAVAVCHKDTSQWSPDYLAFQLLKAKPGKVPICHFLPYGHILWVPY